MGELRQMQTEHAEWLTHNFPNDNTSAPLLGIVEEVGELAHAHLKYEQSIRGYTFDKYVDEAEDALGDLFIYMMSYCNRNGLDLEDIVTQTWNHVKQRDWIANPENAHELTDNEASAEQATWD